MIYPALLAIPQMCDFYRVHPFNQSYLSDKKAEVVQKQSVLVHFSIKSKKSF